MMKKENTGGIAFVIFGVTGDLTKRKLIPALYELYRQGRLSTPFHIIGFARRDWSSEILQQTIKESLAEFSRKFQLETNIIDRILENVHYVQSTFSDQNGYINLAKLLQDLRATGHMFYLATPPESYVDIIQNIGKSGILKINTGFTRIVIEKPYGRDLDSAQVLEEEVHKVFKENQVYRIDHYLGKETVQNILVFRFGNGIFEPLWDRRYVDHVQITVSETHGVGTRAGYYDTAGVIRDMFQNHLLQLLTLTAMESPVAFNADSVRDEKVKVLKALRPLRNQDAIDHTYRAQYVSGTLDDVRVPGYKDEAGVQQSSVTETYLAARILVDNWRWAGVPFYVRSGKRMPGRMTEIAIQFKQAPLSLFDWQNMAGEAPNMLVINIQPDEGITLTFGAKTPGASNHISPVKMEFSYQKAFGSSPPEAYERLLLDCISGDATLFTRSDEVLSQWRFTTDILDAWQTKMVRNLPVYEAGTWGPPGADDFIKKEGRVWHNPDTLNNTGEDD